MSNWKIRQVKVSVGYQPAARPASQPGARAPQERLAAIEAAVQAGDFPRAAALAEAAVKAGVEHPLALSLAALKFEQEGKLDEAFKVLLRAVEIAPGDIGARNGLGLILTRMERYAEALSAFDAALELQPDFAGVHVARGACLEALGRLADAEAAYRLGLSLQPDNVGAMQGLANILSGRGAHAEARPLAEAVLEAEPNFPEALRVLAAADAAEGSR